MSEKVYSFRHEAMNTWFEISFSGINESYARSAATEAFVEIDRLENLLSRYREGSDVDILNKRGSLEPVQVTEECWNCILQAMDLEILTEGIFSIAFEAFMEGSKETETLEAGSWLEMDPAAQSILFRYPGTKIDLGGIGKGYALDLVVQHLRDWEITSLLIHSGTSSVVACGNRDGSTGWPVTIGADQFPHNIQLLDGSLSGSSLAVQGCHILDLGEKGVLDTDRRVWAWAPTGGLSDGLSTSFMLMTLEQIEAICQNHAQLGALVVDPDLQNSPVVLGVAHDYLQAL